MPRYYFEITDGTQMLKPPHAIDLLGDAAAREEALRLAQQVKDGEPGPGLDWEGWFVRIIDADGKEVDSVPIDLAPDEPLAP